MRGRLIALAVLCSLLLTGCNWLSGSYVHISPHRNRSQMEITDGIPVDNYLELLKVLRELVSGATESAVLDVTDYPQADVANHMHLATVYTQGMFPIGAYCVESISYEVGTSSGRPAVAVTIAYSRSRIEIQQIRRETDMDSAIEAIHTALNSHSPRLVMLVETFSDLDIDQVVRDYAHHSPESLMEVPRVSVGLYGSGASRLVELNFLYQNSRESLNKMQKNVQQVFNASELYITGSPELQQYPLLYRFLMERFDYTLETSITPAYSLLYHGVGDSRAFAEVYSAMCRRSGLECLTINGTRDGEPYSWNMICLDGQYCHVDLIRCSQEGGFHPASDEHMVGYVWDYSAYPEAPSPEPETADPEDAAGTQPEDAPGEATGPVTDPTQSGDDGATESQEP